MAPATFLICNRITFLICGIHPRLLKELAPVISEILAVLFQKSLDDGVLPKDWKDAIVSPIFKKGAKHAAANYVQARQSNVSPLQNLGISSTQSHHDTYCNCRE